MEVKKKKADLIRENIQEIKELRTKGMGYRSLSHHLSNKLGIKISMGQLHSIMRKEEGAIAHSNAIKIHLSPEQVNALSEDGVISVSQAGVHYVIESRKWCCKKLRRYARYRGKIVAKFKVCPFCSTKR